MKLLGELVRLCFGGGRKPPSVERIVYSLPHVDVYRKYYNQDQFFADVDWSNWAAVIDGFEVRFQKWYFAHMTGGQASYIDLCALCALVEVLSHYENEKDWHEPKNYKEFLRKLDSVFRKALHEPIMVSRCEAGDWETGKLKDFADVFYTGVRCSLHHHGDLASFAGMSGTGTLATEHTGAGRSLCGKYKCSIVVFDPVKLKERLQKWLQDYCDDLRGNPESDKANRFRAKFLNDFGVTIPNPGKAP